MTPDSHPPTTGHSGSKTSIGELGQAFLRLGCIGFGGPLAHIALIQQEMVHKRRWITAEQFLEGFTLTQILPGPISTQLAIYIGFRLHRIRGALITGGAFILPAFLLLLSLAWAYFRYGTMVAVQGLFYGMTPAVLAMIVLSGYSLSKSAADDWMLAFIAAASAAAIAFFSVSIVLLFALAGLLTMILYGPKRSTPPAGLAALVSIPLLGQLGWYFVKVGALIFGGGLVIVPLLEQEVVSRLGWLTQREFLDGLALGQITPGPVVITATFIGYKVSGLLGAVVATVAIFLPSFVFVIAGSAFMKRIERAARIRAAFKGISAAAVGAILGSAVVLSRAALAGALPILIFISSFFAMFRYQVSFFKVLGAAAILGLAWKWLGME